MRAAALSAVLAVLPVVASAHQVKGNGEKTTVRRELPPFTAVRLEGQLDADVKVGGPQAVAVTIDSNLQEHVSTRVENGTLVVETRDVSYRGPGRIEVTVPALRAVRLAGAGDVRIDGGAGDLALAVEGAGDLRWRGKAGRLTVDLDGASDVSLDGTAEALEVEVDGSGDVKASGLTAHDAKVEVSGTGDVEVTVGGGALAASVSGTGSVRWRGEASAVSTSVSGMGEIVRR
jgi:hypothetical protein